MQNSQGSLREMLLTLPHPQQRQLLLPTVRPPKLLLRLQKHRRRHSQEHRVLRKQKMQHVSLPASLPLRLRQMLPQTLQPRLLPAQVQLQQVHCSHTRAAL